MPRFRLGAYEFINCLPVYAGFHVDEVRLPLGVEIVESVPAVLNNSILFGEIDLTPVSASHYAGREDRFVPLPDLAITSDGEVRSVLLLHRDPIDKLDGKDLAITQKSSTARTMLQVLLQEHWHVQPDVTIGPCYPKDVGKRHDAVLVIGDDALAVHAAGAAGDGEGATGRSDLPDGVHVTDLGAAWKDLTGGPAIWAVWVARRDFKERHGELYGKLETALSESTEWGLDHLDTVVDMAVERTGLSEDVVADYFDGLGYDRDDRTDKALETLKGYKAKLG